MTVDNEQGPLRVGIVGAGGNTRKRHIPGLQAIAGVSVAAVCNRSKASGQRVADAFNIPVVHACWQDLVADPNIDAVVVGTWPYLHAPVTIAALEAGKHVMCEARMAMDLAEARAMLAASVNAPDCVAQVVPAPFSLHVDDEICTRLEEGYIGELLAMTVDACSASFIDRAAPMSWRQNRDLSGQNIMGMGIWYESAMRWVGEAASVFAEGRVFTTRRADESGAMCDVSIPEHLDIIARLCSGAQARFSFSSVTGLAPAAKATLYGSEGTLQFTQGALLGGRAGDDALAPIPLPNRSASGWRVEDEFVSAIRGEESIRRTDFATGVRYMAFTDAVARSLETGRRVDVPAT